MKKVIERMNNSIEEQQALRKGYTPSKDSGSSGKKKWSVFNTGRKSSSSDKVAGAEDEEVEGMRVDFYLVVFLKFISSIVPTIEVDSTAAF